MKSTIYCLIGGENKQLFYIGETRRPIKKRLYEHLQDWQTEIGKKGDAIRANNGNVLIFPILTYQHKKQLDAMLEIMLIRYFYELGFPLTNNKIPFTGRIDHLQIYKPYIKHWRSAVKKVYKKYPEIFGNLSRYT